MEIPRWNRQVTASGSGGGGGMIDPGQIARPTEALKMLGDVVSHEAGQFAYRLDTIIANNQIGDFTLAAERANAEVFENLGDDPMQYEAKYDEMLGKVKSEQLEKVTHPDARRQVESWLDGKDLNWRLDVKKQASNVTIGRAKDVYAASMDLAKSRGDEEMMAAATMRAVQSGIMTPEVAEIKLATAMGDSAKDIALATAKQVFHATGSVTEAIKAIQADPDIRETDKDSLFEDVKTYSAAMKAAGEQESYRKKEAFKKELNKLKFSDEATDLQQAFEIVRKNDGDILTADDQQKELDDIKKRITAAGTIFADVTDDTAYMQVSGALADFKRGAIGRDGYQKILLGNKGKLDEGDYNRMKQSLEDAPQGQDPLKKELVKGLLGDLDNKHKVGYFLNRPFRNDPNKEANMTTENFVKSQKTLAAVHREFTDWVTKNPDADDKQIGEKYKTLMDPTNKELAAMGLSTAWTKEGRRQVMFEGLRQKTLSMQPTEQETPGGFTPDELDPAMRRIWETAKQKGVSWEEFLEDIEEAGL